MKKTLIALAALAATGAYAQSSVTLYGTLDGGIANASKANAAGQARTAFNDSNIASSVWGMRGTEDLGGGMKGLFNIEGDVSTANGQGNGAGTFRRAAWVGVGGGFGELSLGVRINPYILGTIVPQVATSNSGLVNFLYAIGAPDFFPNNAITYTTPAMGGLSAQVQYAPGGVAGGGTRSDAMAAHVVYSAGGLTLVAAGQDRKGAGAAGATTAANVVFGDSNKTSSVFAAKYNMGPLTLSGLYHNQQVALTTAVDAAKKTITGYQVAAGYAVSPALTLVGNYFSADPSGAVKASTMYTVEAYYSLSKRTKVYGMLLGTSNDAGGVATAKTFFLPAWGMGIAAGAAGVSNSTVGAGVIHSF